MTTASPQQNVAVWFEIPAADFDRAVGFYEKVFDTQLRREKWGPSDMAVFPHEGEAVSGCIMAGGKVATPKTALPPGMGYIAHFVDSEGNRVGRHSIE